MAVRITRVSAAVSGTPDTATRITRVSAAVGGTPAAALTRLQRIGLQILADSPPAPKTGDGVNTLVITQVASVIIVVSLSANNAISLTDSADLQISVVSVDATNTLALTDEAGNNVFLLDANNAIVLGQSESVTAPRRKSATNAIVITDASSFTQTGFGRIAANNLTITQSTESNIKNLFATTPDPQSDIPFSNGFTENWVQVPRITDTFILSASSTISLSQTLPQPTGKRSVSATNTLDIQLFADNNVKARSVSNTLSINQEATFFKVHNASNTLSITQTVQQGFINLEANNTLTFNQLARSNPFAGDGVSALTLTHAATSSIKELSANNALVMSQDINVIRPYRVDVENKISGTTDDIFIPPIGPVIPGIPFGMSDEATVQIFPIRNPVSLINFISTATVVHLKVDAVDLTALSNIGFISKANLSTTSDAQSIINLTDSANADKNTLDPLNVLLLIDQAVVSVKRDILNLSNTIGLKQSVAFSRVRDTTDCEYSPFIGESSDPITPPRPSLPKPHTPTLPGIRFRLVYPPFDVGTNVDTIDLRAPQFGNRERLDATRINRESAGGSLTIFADPIWPEVHILQMTFLALKQTQARSLLTFIERWLGKEIGIYDYEGRVWRGIITNPDEAVTQDGLESFSASLEIEAKRVHPLNRVAASNLGMDVSGAQTTNQSRALSIISVGQSATFILKPVLSGINSLDMTDNSDYNVFPVVTGSSAIGLFAFSTRNSFFRESASSVISLAQVGANLDFDDFGNLIHNWDAENTLGTSDGNPLSTWADLGTNSITLNATVSQEPTARDSVLNGRRVIEFRHAGATQRMVSASNLSLFDVTNKVGTIFIITIVREVLGGGNETILGNNTDKIMLGGTTSTERPVSFKSGEGIVALETPTSVLANGTTQLLMIRRNNNDITFRRNKTDEDGTTLSTNPVPGNELLNFGGFNAAGNSVDQDIAQVLIYDDILSDADILTIEGLLSAKWGV